MKSIVSVHLLVSLIYYLTSIDARRSSNHGFPLYFRKDNIIFIADDSRTVGLLACKEANARSRLHICNSLSDTSLVSCEIACSGSNIFLHNIS